jgi:lipid II:glycine glycyltransferase (peptidoglycan interpeptide bridge formation enzyme)
MEIQQTPEYATYIRLLGWNVERIDDINVYWRILPFIGGIAKIQRPHILPSVDHIRTFVQKNQIRTIVAEACHTEDAQKFTDWYRKLETFVRIDHSPYIPTKTIIVDLAGDEKKIFSRFSEAKRRAVRRAQKNSITIVESDDIRTATSVKNKSAGFLGFMTTHGIKELWQAFYPEHITTLLAKTPDQKDPVGMILLLFYGDTAFYWIAGASKKGKKLFAPTLLVYKALLLSKNRGCTLFDFIGVWDDRTPHLFGEWKGFTKFKEGFGGTEQYYPIAGFKK